MYLCFVSFSRQKREELAQKVAEERARREEESRRLEAEQAREREEQLRRQAEERERREREDQERAQKQVGALPAGGPGPESGRGAAETSPRASCVRVRVCARIRRLPRGPSRLRLRRPVVRKHRPHSCFQKEEEARLREEAERVRQEREKHFQREEQERLERKKVISSKIEAWGTHCSHSSPDLKPQKQETSSRLAGSKCVLPTPDTLK